MKIIGKDGKKTSILEMTAENYACPAGEELLFHVKIENLQFDPKTGARRSHPRIQKFGRKSFFAKMLPALKKNGYDVEILHNPEEWLKAHPVPEKGRGKAPAIDIEKIKADLKAELKAEMEAKLKAEMEAKTTHDEASEVVSGSESPAPEEFEPIPEELEPISEGKSRKKKSKE
ncbi:MAG: hypothetical protein IKX02_00070 [Spirochaetales bacterium]|nr:hypothetical protein [Spirochaetales bacterium]